MTCGKLKSPIARESVKIVRLFSASYTQNTSVGIATHARPAIGGAPILEHTITRQDTQPAALTATYRTYGHETPLALYRAILIHVKALPDSNCARIIQTLVRSRFEKLASTQQWELSTKARRDARKCLVTLQKAHAGDLKSLTKVIQSAYGQRGKMRHFYMTQVNSEHNKSAPELIPGKSRSRPPVVGTKLAALWKLQFEVKRTIISLPLGPGGDFGKPLDKRREANLRWWHHTDLLERTIPPLPAQQAQILQDLALGRKAFTTTGVPAWRRETHMAIEQMAKRACTDTHIVRPRLLRRIYQNVLHKSPVLYKTDEKTWHACYMRAQKREPVAPDLANGNFEEFDMVGHLGAL